MVQYVRTIKNGDALFSSHDARAEARLRKVDSGPGRQEAARRTARRANQYTRLEFGDGIACLYKMQEHIAKLRDRALVRQRLFRSAPPSVGGLPMNFQKLRDIQSFM